MDPKRLKTFILISVFSVILFLGPVRLAWAGSSESTFGFGSTFYSGTAGTNLTPLVGLQINYSAGIPLAGNFLDLVNRFELGLLLVGSSLGSSSGSYNGLMGSMEFGFRFNLAKGAVIPYLEIGPSLALYELYLSGAGNSSANQTALKYGYILGVGFDKYHGSGRGSGGGWGIGVSYFNFLNSPSAFEFPAGAASTKGVKLDIRIHFGHGN